MRGKSKKKDFTEQKAERNTERAGRLYASTQPEWAWALGLGLRTWSRRRSFSSARRCGPPSTYPFRTCAVVRSSADGARNTHAAPGSARTCNGYTYRAT
jgi:hypothetical protein